MKLLKYILIVVLFMMGCSSEGTVNVGNPSSTTITIGQLTAESKSTITIPDDVFGGAEAIDDSTFLVKVNSVEQGSALEASDYYSESTGNVSFIISNLSNGDELTFLIFLSGTQRATYSGEVSDAADTEASEVTATVSGVFRVVAGEDTCTTDSNPDGYGIADSSDRDDLCISITSDNEVLALDLDDDLTIIVDDIDGNVISVSFLETMLYDTTCVGEVSADGETITGSCSSEFGGEVYTCVLSYEKVGDDAFESVSFEGQNYGCDDPDGFIDMRRR